MPYQVYICVRTLVNDLLSKDSDNLCRIDSRVGRTKIPGNAADESSAWKMVVWGLVSPFIEKMSSFHGAVWQSLVLSSDDEATLGGTEDVTRSVDSKCEKDEESIDANRDVGVGNEGGKK